METQRRRRTEKGGGGRSSMVEKLKQGVLLKRVVVGPSTPPPSWRLELPSSSMHNNEEFLNFPPTISARKLCANLWEILPHQHTPPVTRLRRRRHRRAQKPLAEPPHNSSDQPESASSSLRRHVAASPVQRRRSVDSYHSTVEVAPHSCAVTPTSSADLKGMIGESSHNRTTSAELLKVLNRIWSLEEQHVSNVSAVKALKVELDHSQSWMKELLREKQMNKQEMENLMKQTAVDRFVRKNKEHDRVKAAVQSVKEELEDERRLRKHSETLRHKLSRELSEARSSFSGCLRSLERERKARILLENLCDEFAKGIRDFEQEVHSMRRKPDKGHDKGNDRLILHISEAWLDERMQMKISQSGNDLADRNSIVDKLGFDIETFLRAKRAAGLKNCGYPSPKELKEIFPCHQSMDSFPLKEAAPQDMAREDSIGADFLEPKRVNGDDTTIEIDRIWRTLRMNSCHSYDDDNQVIGNSSLSSEGDKVYPESTVCREENSCVAAGGSPAKLQKSKSIVSDFDESKSSAKLPKGVKDYTLMAKLLEARLEGKKSRSGSRKSTS